MLYQMYQACEISTFPGTTSKTGYIGGKKLTPHRVVEKQESGLLEKCLGVYVNQTY